MWMLRRAVLVLVVCAVGACDAPGTAELDGTGLWASRAEEWQEARAVIAEANPIHVMRFCSHDALFDDHTWVSYHYGGHADVPSYMFLAMRGSPPTVDGLYLSTDGILLDYRYTEYGVTASLLEANQVTASGITVGVLADVHRERNILDPVHDRVGQLLAIAEGHVRYWAGEDGSSPYAEDAVIVDSLLGVEIHGEEIDQAAVSTGKLLLPGSTLAELPDGQGPAVFTALADEDDDGHDLVYTLVASDDGSGCPGAVAFALETKNGEIVSETRYHEVASARLCIVDLPGGWWDSVGIPESSDPLVTGVITRANGETTTPILDGTTQMVGLISWAIDRFPAAGLATPDLRSVTFVDESSKTCEGGVEGNASGDGDIILCVNPWLADETDIDLKRLVLHEIGHVWIDDHLDNAARDRFIRHVGAVGWADLNVPWHERGVEQAANALMYGLMDEVEAFDVIEPPFDQTRVCRVRAENFEVLTRHEAIAPCEPQAGP